MSSSATRSEKEIRILIADDHPIVTVKNHVSAILKKLSAMGRTEAIAIASGRGLVNIG